MSTELSDFEKKAIAYSSSGLSLKEFYLLLKTAHKPFEFNTSPVDIVNEMRQRNQPLIKKAMADLEAIFEQHGIDPKSIT